MADLIVRISGCDEALLSRLAAPSRIGLPATARRPFDRIVVDAHTAAATPDIARTARRAGIPMLIDPQTFYLQDQQHPADPWAKLPFASSSCATVGDLLNPEVADRLIAESLEFQLTHGASILTTPYVHVERADDGWAQVQVALHRRTRRYLDGNNLRMPLLAPLALSWRLLGRTTWPAALDELVAAIQVLEPTEVALVASKIDQGTRADRRLADLYATIRRVRRKWPVIAWQQGVLGEACVAAGAAGYETGIGWRERCDLRAQMGTHRRPAGQGFGARPVYIAALGRSIPKSTVAALLTDHPAITADLVCLDPKCCPAGRHALTSDARTHAVIARATRLATISAAAHPRWAWKHLSTQSTYGLELADRINTIASRNAGIAKVDTTALHAIAVTSDVRRQVASRRHAA